jgi:hypothetical protein
MAKGIWEFVPCSRDGEDCIMPSDGPKKALAPLLPGGTVEVGEGSTSLNLEGGSLRSGFHMPVPHGKFGAPGVRPMAEEAECEPHGPALVSAEGVLGWEVVGDIELLAKEPLRGRLKDCEVSLSHDDRRTGLVCGTLA